MARTTNGKTLFPLLLLALLPLLLVVQTRQGTYPAPVSSFSGNFSNDENNPPQKLAAVSTGGSATLLGAVRDSKLLCSIKEGESRGLFKRNDNNYFEATEDLSNNFWEERSLLNKQRKMTEATAFNDYVVGTTGLRFRGCRPYKSQLCDVNDFAEFRCVTASLLSLLRWGNLFEENFTEDDLEYISESSQNIKEILAVHPTFANQLRPCCFTLIAFQLLDRLNEIDREPLIAFIKSRQLKDGGFLSSWAEMYSDPHDSFYKGVFSDLKATLGAVCALDAVGERPMNTSAVKEFVYGLQVLNSSDSWENYLFRPFYPDPPLRPSRPAEGLNNAAAAVILDKLGFEKPHKEELNELLTERLNNFTANFSGGGRGDILTINSLSLLAFYLEDQSVIDLLREFAWEVHQNLKEYSPYLTDKTDGEFFACILARLGKAGFRLQYLLSPAQFAPTPPAGRQAFTLRIINQAVFKYTIQLKSLQVINGSFFLDELPKETITIQPGEFTDIPLRMHPIIHTTTTTTAAETAPTNPLSLKLVVESPVIGAISIADIISSFTVSSEVFFELHPSEPKANLSPVTLGLIVGLPISAVVAGSIIVGGVVHRKRKNR